MRKRTLAEVCSSPGAKQLKRKEADNEVGRGRSKSRTEGRSRSGSRGGCEPQRGGRRAGARGARGRRGRGRGGRRWAGALGQEALQVENANRGNEADGYKVPLTSSADKPDKKKKSLRIGVWNCFGLAQRNLHHLRAGVSLFRLFVFCCWVMRGSAASSCQSDIDCSLNAVCKAGSCICDAPWGGTTCGTLEFAQTAATGAYGMGAPLADRRWRLPQRQCPRLCSASFQAMSAQPSMPCVRLAHERQRLPKSEWEKDHVQAYAPRREQHREQQRLGLVCQAWCCAQGSCSSASSCPPFPSLSGRQWLVVLPPMQSSR
eukprot:SAG11_NODE_438_length_9463_cov_47.214957_8_plen_317_part_00